MKKIFLVLVMLSVGLFASDSVKSEDQKGLLDDWIPNGITIKSYKDNYFLPYSVRKSGSYKSYEPGDTYKDTEAEIQISFKINLVDNLFGLDGKYYVAYTQNSFWQLYIDSKPFRENNYNPEMFAVYPVTKPDSFLNLRRVKFAIAHNSNGQGNNSSAVGYTKADNRSRSINYVYTTLSFEHGALNTHFKAWAPMFRDSDNPDIMKYTGYTSLRLNYLRQKHMVNLLGRISPETGRGAVEASYSYPIFRDSVYVYAKAFSGYGESLIDYDNHLTKFSIGLSFTRQR